MAPATVLHKAALFRPGHSKDLEKVRWSIQQRLRKQMAQLSANLFDEVDDYLFASGQQGQFSEDSVYLSAMREFRAKQAIFEDTFLVVALHRFQYKSLNNNSIDSLGDGLTVNSEHNVIYEKMETDLALGAMRRRSEKLYAPFVKQIVKQIASLNETAHTDSQAEFFANISLVDAVLQGFEDAQNNLSLSLNLRLIFMKLFEQHFLLQMEKLFLDIISILGNVNDRDFVDKLYSSSSMFEIKAEKENNPTQNQHSENEVLVSGKNNQDSGSKFAYTSESTNRAVDELLDSLCKCDSLPPFVADMLRIKWRSVLVLIGMNRGFASIEWQEAKHVMMVLIALINGDTKASDGEVASLLAKIRQGFTLIQFDRAGQDYFMLELESFLGSRNAPLCDFQEIERVASNIVEEATISPAGEQILDHDDLNEIAKLLGAGLDDGSPISKPAINRKEISTILPKIHGLPNRCKVQLMLDNVAHECELIRSKTESEVYLLSNKEFSSVANAASRVIDITRSALGLAISISEGELFLPAATNQTGVSNEVSQATVMENSQPDDFS